MNLPAHSSRFGPAAPAITFAELSPAFAAANSEEKAEGIDAVPLRREAILAFEWRPQRGGLEAAMAEKRTFETWDDFLMFLRDDWSDWYATVSDVKVEPYAYDERIHWNTYIVSGAIHYTVRGEQKTERTVFGFTNGDPMQPE